MPVTHIRNHNVYINKYPRPPWDRKREELKVSSRVLALHTECPAFQPIIPTPPIHNKLKVNSKQLHKCLTFPKQHKHIKDQYYYFCVTVAKTPDCMATLLEQNLWIRKVCVARDLHCSLAGSRGDRRESRITHLQGPVSSGRLPPVRSLLKFSELAKTAPPTRYLDSNACAYEDISYSDHIQMSGEERRHSSVGRIL